MPRGDKSAYTDKQKRKATHIEQGYRQDGVPKDEAAARAWATVNKEDGGGRKSGSGRKTAGKASARKRAAPKKPAARSASSKKTTARGAAKH